VKVDGDEASIPTLVPVEIAALDTVMAMLEVLPPDASDKERAAVRTLREAQLVGQRAQQAARDARRQPRLVLVDLEPVHGRT
jgi:hypothetical protein